jgi:hypothetical protein
MFIKLWYAIPGVHWYYIQRNRGQLIFLAPKRKLLPPCRIIGQICILRHTLTINFSQENMRYLI